jgi:hypothetical protein
MEKTCVGGIEYAETVAPRLHIAGMIAVAEIR